MTASCPISLRTKLAVCFFVIFFFLPRPAAARTSQSGSERQFNRLYCVGSEEAKRQVQSLIEKGRNSTKTIRMSRAAETFKQVISQDPITLKVTYGWYVIRCVDKRPKATTSTKKQSSYSRRESRLIQRRDAFSIWERLTALHQDEEAARAYRQATKLKPEDEEAFYQLEWRTRLHPIIRKRPQL